MARGFNTTYGTANTDRVVTTYTGSATTQSWALWEWRNGDGGSSLGTLFDKRNSGVNGYRIFRNEPARGEYEFYATWNAGTQLVNRVARPATGAWNHWVITYDASAAANNAVIYLNGSSVTVTRFGTGPTTGSLDTNSDPYCIGSYNISPFTRAWDGMIAEFGIWNAILTAGEAAALAKGFTPDQIRPASLVEYVPLLRDNISRKNAAPTITGALVQPHPRVIMPHRRMARRFTTASAPAGLAAHPMRGGGAAANPIWAYV